MIKLPIDLTNLLRALRVPDDHQLRERYEQPSYDPHVALRIELANFGELVTPAKRPQFQLNANSNAVVGRRAFFTYTPPPEGARLLFATAPDNVVSSTWLLGLWPDETALPAITAQAAQTVVSLYGPEFVMRGVATTGTIVGAPAVPLGVFAAYTPIQPDLFIRPGTKLVGAGVVDNTEVENQWIIQEYLSRY